MGQGGNQLSNLMNDPIAKAAVDLGIEWRRCDLHGPLSSGKLVSDLPGDHAGRS
jgi:hypothetical protein